MTTETFVPRKAEKKRVKLKMAIQGPSGSGKTWGALELANNLWPDAKICVIDTENESASLYADKFAFDTIALAPPFETARYLACLNAVVKAEYDVLIMDSITPQWDGEGGILRRKEELERRNPTVNGYTLWARFTPEHEAFKQAMQQAPIHIIATMRSKQEYALQSNDKGKLVPVKMGLAPIQRDQMDYEFTLVFDVGMTHIATVSKDRTGLFNEQGIDLASPQTAEAIRGWLENVAVTASPAPTTAPETLTAAEPIASKPSTQKRTEAHTHSDVGPFELKGDILKCVIRSAVQKETSGVNPRQYMLVTWNGSLQGLNFASCFDTAQEDALQCGVGKVCHLKMKVWKEGDKFLNILAVAAIDGNIYEGGAPTGEVLP